MVAGTRYFMNEGIGRSRGVLKHKKLDALPSEIQEFIRIVKKLQPITIGELRKHFGVSHDRIYRILDGASNFYGSRIYEDRNENGEVEIGWLQ